MKPIFMQDIAYLGKPFWVEIEGYNTMVRATSGSFAFVASEIIGWNCETIGDIWKKEQEVNFAPRIRYWDEKPTEEERRTAAWSDESRAWMMKFSAHTGKKALEDMYEEYKKTGRTQFEE